MRVIGAQPQTKAVLGCPSHMCRPRRFGADRRRRRSFGCGATMRRASRNATRASGYARRRRDTRRPRLSRRIPRPAKHEKVPKVSACISHAQTKAKRTRLSTLIAELQTCSPIATREQPPRLEGTSPVICSSLLQHMVSGSKIWTSLNFSRLLVRPPNSRSLLRTATIRWTNRGCGKVPLTSGVLQDQLSRLSTTISCKHSF